MVVTPAIPVCESVALRIMPAIAEQFINEATLNRFTKKLQPLVSACHCPVRSLIIPRFPLDPQLPQKANTGIA
ncbi:MAG: hypothetical protein CME58_07080 [Halieaceae bacterium]|nr:hypothetical protein [Halieaceae bacterium]|tara:strand:- start:152 stop:370 length:219 start_codon:yes stop_codon:yes gene_type:complete